jgi:hypothetical protein
VIRDANVCLDSPAEHHLIALKRYRDGYLITAKRNKRRTSFSSSYAPVFRRARLSVARPFFVGVMTHQICWKLKKGVVSPHLRTMQGSATRYLTRVNTHVATLQFVAQALLGFSQQPLLAV